MYAPFTYQEYNLQTLAKLLGPHRRAGPAAVRVARKERLIAVAHYNSLYDTNIKASNPVSAAVSKICDWYGLGWLR